MAGALITEGVFSIQLSDSVAVIGDQVQFDVLPRKVSYMQRVFQAA